MPTKNRRVATYLPKEIDDRLKEFISERGLKGDSPALIEILSEYFGVSRQVAQSVDYSSFATQEQFSELSSRLSDTLKDLLNRIEALEEKGQQPVTLMGGTNETHTTTPSVAEVLVSPGQMDLLDLTEDESPVSQSELNPEGGIKPCNGNQLSKRFGLAKDSVAGAKRSRSAEDFLEWTKKKDPNGIGWQYNPEDKLYYPIVNSSPISFSSSPI